MAGLGLLHAVVIHALNGLDCFLNLNRRLEWGLLAWRTLELA